MKNSTNVNGIYQIRNLPFDHAISELNILSQEKKASLSLLKEFDYQYLIDKIKSNIEIFHKEKINKTIQTNNNTDTNSNSDSNFNLIFPNSPKFYLNKILKIIEKTYTIKINYKTHTEKKTTENTNINKFYEIKTRQESIATNKKWSNFQLDFSYKYYNEENKTFQIFNYFNL